VAYDKLNFVDNAPPDLDAENLNHLEQGIFDAAADADAASSAAQGALVAALPVPAYAPAGLTNRYNPARSSYNVKSSNTRRWRAALAKAGNGGIGTELWIGDSELGGCNSLTAGTGSDTTVWDRLHAAPRQYAAQMSKRGIPILGNGKIKAYDGTHIDARWSLSAGWSTGITCTQASHAGEVATYTAERAGDRVYLTYYDYGASADAIHVSIDGASSGAGYLSIAPGGTHTWKRAALTGVSVHVGSVITVTTTTNTLTIFADIEVRNGTAGLIVHNAGLSGSQATGSGSESWSDLSGGYSPLDQYSPGSSPLFLGETPDVVHVALGFFDLMNSATVTAFKTALTAIRNAFPNSDFVLHVMPWPGSSTLNAWSPYIQAMYQLADTLDVPLLDLQDILGGYTAEAALGLTGDTTVHLLPAAYAIWGTAVAELATAAVGRSVDDPVLSLLGTFAPLLEPAATYTYNGDGTVASETIGGVATAYTYNGDGTVATATRAGVTRTFTYNTDGTIASVA
jgi:YD repeat-containing protein